MVAVRADSQGQGGGKGRRPPRRPQYELELSDDEWPLMVAFGFRQSPPSHSHCCKQGSAGREMT